MEVELKEDNTEFLKDYEAAIKPVMEKHERQLVPVFRFGGEWLPANLLVQKYEASAKPETEQSADPKPETPEKSGGKGKSDS